jgi:hypothetical protein
MKKATPAQTAPANKPQHPRLQNVQPERSDFLTDMFNRTPKPIVIGGHFVPKDIPLAPKK